MWPLSKFPCIICITKFWIELRMKDMDDAHWSCWKNSFHNWYNSLLKCFWWFIGKPEVFNPNIIANFQFLLMLLNERVSHTGSDYYWTLLCQEDHIASTQHLNCVLHLVLYFVIGSISTHDFYIESQKLLCKSFTNTITQSWVVVVVGCGKFKSSKLNP